MVSSFFQKIFVNTFLLTEAEAETFRNNSQSKNLDRKTIIICLLIAFCISMHWYLSNSFYLYQFLNFSGYTLSANANDIRLLELGWWVAVLIAFYFLLPVLFIKLVFKENLADYGLKFKGAFADYELYVIMLVFMIPLVLYFSTTASFQAKYPFYQSYGGQSQFPNLLIWEIIYFIQFLGVEFFFRGFIVHGTKHRFGYYSVFVMTIPYCMVHFGKPLPETIAAIIAGIVLGTLSLKSRSILLGIAIHYSVAIIMDIAALWQKGLL
jgi:membrane protease YdiL (CAAX protease family)